MKICSVCGSPEHPAWKAHVFATNSSAGPWIDGATNTERLTDATNEAAARPDARVNQSRGSKAPSGVKEGSASKTANRRTRQAYNAYQRLYMQTKRAIAAGKAVPLRFA